MARDREKVQTLVKETRVLAPANRAKQHEDWSVVDQVRVRNRGKGVRTISGLVDRAVREVRREQRARPR